jgi:hypothetical protein
VYRRSSASVSYNASSQSLSVVCTRRTDAPSFELHGLASLGPSYGLRIKPLEGADPQGLGYPPKSDYRPIKMARFTIHKLTFTNGGPSEWA